MKIGFFAGSFDPFTVGHLFVAKSAAQIFDKVIIGIGVNENKTRRFDKQKMKAAIEEDFKRLKITNVAVMIYNGYTVDAAKKMSATVLVRGVRNQEDFENEEKLAAANKELSGIETIYFRTGEYGFVSSTMVFEKLKNGESVENLVPPAVLKLITEK